jgi:anti-anti-sigma factor
MRRSRRRAFVHGHGPARYPSATARRGSDVAVTCWDRGSGPAAAEQPAARVSGAGSGSGSGPVDQALVEVVLGPELVAARTRDIRAVVDPVLAAAPAVLRLRLDAVRRFDGAGVGLLLGVHQRARQQGVHLVCTCPPRQLVAVLRRTRLDHVLTVQP